MLRKWIVPCGLLFCVSGPLHALEANGVSWGQLKLIPTLGITLGYDYNVARSDVGSELGSYYWMLSPGIRLELPSDESRLSVTWETDIGRYMDSSENDFEDWSLRADWVWDPTSRTNITLFGALADAHTERGEGVRQGDDALLALPIDEYESLSYGAGYTYGAVGARGRIALDYSVTELDYKTNPEFTEAQDRDIESYGGTFFLRIRPKTSALIGVQWVETDYRLDSFPDNPEVATLDGDSTYWFLGLTWDVSARTTGRIDYGWHERRFDAPDRLEYDKNFWRANVQWAPRSYSTLDLTVTRDTEETVGYGDYILRDEIRLSWRHSWGTRFDTIVEYGIGEDDPQPDPRHDDYTTWGVSGRWQISDHFQFGLGWQHFERETNISGLDYDKDIFLLTFELSL